MVKQVTSDQLMEAFESAKTAFEESRPGYNPDEASKDMWSIAYEVIFGKDQRSGIRANMARERDVDSLADVIRKLGKVVDERIAAAEPDLKKPFTEIVRNFIATYVDTFKETLAELNADFRVAAEDIKDLKAGRER